MFQTDQGITVKELWWWALLLAVFMATSVILYSPGFNAPMYLDSFYRLQQNSAVFESKSLPDVLRIFPPRPLSMLSFYNNFLLTGMSPFYFRLFNAILLSLTSFAIYPLILLILKTPAIQATWTPIEEKVVALIAAYLFLTHPVQTFVVLYIIQRMALLACFFTVCSLLLYMATRLNLIDSKKLGYGATVLFTLCAFLTKQNTIVLPAIFVLCELALFRSHVKGLLKLGAAGISLLVIALIALSLLEQSPSPERQGGIIETITINYHMVGISFVETALTQCRIFFYYIRDVLAPFITDPLLVRPFVISQSWINPPVTFFALVGFGTIATTGLALLWLRPLIGVGIWIFILGLVPESLFAPLHLYFGHRLHLPMVGILLIGVDVILMILGWAKARGSAVAARVVCMSLCAFWCVSAIWTTHNTAKLWSRPIEMWEKSVQAFPTGDKVEIGSRVNALNLLAEAKEKSGKYNEAATVYERAVEIAPDYTTTLLNLSRIYLVLGKNREAESTLRHLLSVDPRDAKGHSNLAWLALRHNRNAEEAAIHAHKAIEINPKLWQAHIILGDALIKLGKEQEAIKHYQEALRIQPRSQAAWNKLKRYRPQRNTVDRPE